MSVVRGLFFVAVVFLVGTPAYASSITVLVGDKDGFGIGLAPGANLPWLAPIYDERSAAEKVATNGAQLTDTFSALYSGTESDCPNGCTPNSDTGYVIFQFKGLLQSASLTILMGDFESLVHQPMLANINGVPINFFFNHGRQKTATEQLVLTSQMIDAANRDGEVRLFLDHRAFWDDNNYANSWGTWDYIAFDYFELNGEVAPVPEPGTFLLLGAGLAGLAVRRRLTSSRRRSR